MTAIQAEVFILMLAPEDKTAVFTIIAGFDSMRGITVSTFYPFSPCAGNLLHLFLIQLHLLGFHFYFPSLSAVRVVFCSVATVSLLTYIYTY